MPLGAPRESTVGYICNWETNGYFSRGSFIRGGEIFVRRFLVGKNFGRGEAIIFPIDSSCFFQHFR